MGSAAGFRVIDSICSRIGSFGRGLIEESAMDFLCNAGVSAFGTFAALAPVSIGNSSSGSSWTRLRLVEEVLRRLSAASLKVSIQAKRRSFASGSGTSY